MPTRDWATIRQGLIANYNPKVTAQFGATPTAAQQASMNQLLIQSRDSSLIAQSRIALFNLEYPSSGTDDAYAVCPDGWLLRPEYHRAQAIYQFVEIDNTGKVIGSPKYRITIPHHNSTKPTTALPNYQRGSWEIIYVLSDNSKITIHSLDQDNGMLILNAAKALVDSNYLIGAYLSKSCLVGSTTPIAQKIVKCRMAKFYSTGVLNVFPDWLVKW